MRIIAIGLTALVAVLAADVQPSEAQGRQGPRPWCMEESGSRGGSGIPWCNFWTFEQCQMSARGMGWCVPNPKLGWDARERAQRRGPVR